MGAAPEGEWVLDVLGVPYGGPYGGRDAHGEYFTPESDLWLERIPRRPVVYYHGLTERYEVPAIIGEELGWERRQEQGSSRRRSRSRWAPGGAARRAPG